MIRLRTITLAAVSAFIATVTAAGCGSSGDSGFVDKDGDGKPDNDGTSGVGGDVTNGAGDAGVGPGANPGNVGDVANCASQTATSALGKANLITIFDSSGSMGNYTDNNNVYHPNQALRWDPVTKAMMTFFTDPKSAGLNASLQYFPLNDTCSVDGYAAPAVPRTALPNQLFATSLDIKDPDGGTPTRPALEGALRYARKVAGENTKEKTVILLVTDGEPNSCSSDVQSVSEVADTAYKGDPRNSIPSIPVYVIGVGDETDPAKGGTFNQVAKSGGTNQAIHVKTGNAGQTSSELIARLQEIRRSTLSCSFGIPAPPKGGTINYDAVRVNFTSSKNVASTVPYSEACTGNNGWHYDNKTSPKQIVLCTNSCKTIQDDPGGKINIAFDCKGTQADGGSGGVH